MKKIGCLDFPDSVEEAENWEHFVSIHALSRCVLCVAHTRIEGTWCAYCDVVPGLDHDNEFQDVLEHGDKLSKRIAEVIFPKFKDIPYAY